MCELHLKPDQMCELFLKSDQGSRIYGVVETQQTQDVITLYGRQCEVMMSHPGSYMRFLYVLLTPAMIA